MFVDDQLRRGQAAGRGEGCHSPGGGILGVLGTVGILGEVGNVDILEGSLAFMK